MSEQSAADCTRTTLVSVPGEMLLLDGHIHHVLVTENNHVGGLMSSPDLLRFIAREVGVEIYTTFYLQERLRQGPVSNLRGGARTTRFVTGLMVPNRISGRSDLPRVGFEPTLQKTMPPSFHRGARSRRCASPLLHWRPCTDIPCILHDPNRRPE